MIPAGATWRRSAPTPEQRAGLFSARRMGLGVAASELLRGRDPAAALLRIESGHAPIPEDLERRLRKCLEAHVACEIAAGRRWQDIRVPGWGAADIYEAAKVAGSLEAT